VHLVLDRGWRVDVVVVEWYQGFRLERCVGRLVDGDDSRYCSYRYRVEKRCKSEDDEVVEPDEG
jgi:hypothetical protein